MSVVYFTCKWYSGFYHPYFSLNPPPLHPPSLPPLSPLSPLFSFSSSNSSSYHHYCHQLLHLLFHPFCHSPPPHSLLGFTLYIAFLLPLFPTCCFLLILYGTLPFSFPSHLPPFIPFPSFSSELVYLKKGRGGEGNGRGGKIDTLRYYHHPKNYSTLPFLPPDPFFPSHPFQPSSYALTGQ